MEKRRIRMALVMPLLVVLVEAEVRYFLVQLMEGIQALAEEEILVVTDRLVPQSMRLAEVVDLLVQEQMRMDQLTLVMAGLECTTRLLGHLLDFVVGVGEAAWLARHLGLQVTEGLLERLTIAMETMGHPILAAADVGG
jgi:hypothetical protein